MKHLLMACLLPLSLFAQQRLIREFPGIPQPQMEDYIFYYNFYHGVQIVELDYYDYNIAVAQREDIINVRNESATLHARWDPSHNTYLLRDTTGKILASYRGPQKRYNWEYSLLPPGKVTTIAHASRSRVLHADNSPERYEPYNAGDFIYRIFGHQRRQGLMDTLGARLMDTVYNRIAYYPEYKKYFYTQQAVCGVMDSRFNKIFQGQYQLLAPFNAGRLFVRQGNMQGIINYKGDTLLAFDYTSIIYADSICYLEKNGLKGIMDTQCHILIPPLYSRVTCCNKDLYFARLNGGWGLLDGHGRELTGFAYDEEPGSFVNGYAVVHQAEYPVGGYGFIDLSGHEVSKLKYENVDNFREGFACVQRDGKWGLINKHGEEVLAPEYYEAHCSGRFSLFRQKDRLYSVYKASTDTVIVLRYDAVGCFSNGLAKVSSHNKWGYIDTQFRKVIPPQYDQIGDFYNRLATVQLGEKYGVVNSAGRKVVPIIYDLCFVSSQPLIMVKTGSLYGFLNKQGKPVIPVEYYSAEYLEDGKVMLRKERQWFIFNEKGELVETRSTE